MDASTPTYDEGGPELSRLGGSRAEATEARGTLGTVRNAVVLLDLLSEGPAYRQLTELADSSGLSVPTVHRLLRSLVVADLVEQDPRSARYGLGPEVARLSVRYLARLPILRALAPYLLQLRDATGATVQVALLVRGSVVYVDRVDGGADGHAGPYRDPHRVRPALGTAAGRVLAAHADDDAWEQVMAGADPAAAAAARAERPRWRAAPYLAGDGDELTSPAEIAVPVCDAGGRCLAALSAALDGSEGIGEPRTRTLAGQLAKAALATGRTLGAD